MYIAFKWLVGLTLAMWIAICCLDVYLPKNGKNEHYPVATSNERFKSRNRTIKLYQWDKNKDKIKQKQNNLNTLGESTVIHYLIFAAGALVVSIFHRKNDIIFFTKKKITSIHKHEIGRRVRVFLQFFKTFAAQLSVAAKKKYFRLKIILKINVINLKIFYETVKINFYTFLYSENNINPGINEIECYSNFILLNKVKEIVYKRKRLLESVSQTKTENTNVAPRVTAGSELMRNVDAHNNHLRQNNNLQHLYVITRHENIILKNRLKRISQERNEMERNLIFLMNEIFCSTNDRLKSICSQVIVNAEKKTLNDNVKKEIIKCLEKTHDNSEASLSQNVLDDSIQTDVALYDNSKENGPHFKHLPGDFVWTVKGKDGVIEKLYEYTFDSNCYGGNSIRRIREYSVYFDKDRIINTSISYVNVPTPTKVTMENCYQAIKNKKFLTESIAFKKFLIACKRPPALME